MKKDDPFFSWGVFAVLAVLFYMTKYLSPVAIEHWFNGGAKGLLDMMAFSSPGQPLNYYLGKLEELYFGPLSFLFAGTAFLILCRKNLLDSSLKIFAAGVFLFLFLTRLEIMFWPPYGDSASGPFIEAYWLLHHGFDYITLSQQPGFVQGGPKVYLFSVYPTVMAVFKALVPHLKTFWFLNHVLTFAMAGFMVAVFRQIMLKVANKELSLLMALLLLYLPLFQSQAEQINMEMPSAFFAMLAVYFLIEKKIARASLMSMAAISVKGVAVYVSVAVFLVALIYAFTEGRGKDKFKNIIWGVAALSFALLIYYGSFYILNRGGSVKMVGVFAGWRWMKSMPLFYLYVISFLMLCWHFFTQEYDDKDSILTSSLKYFKKHSAVIIMFLTAGGWFLLFINSYGGQYRYRLILAPATLFCVFYAVHLRTRSVKVKAVLLYFLLFCSLLFSYGLIYGPVFDSNDSTLERSLEYRNDIKLDFKIANAFEKMNPDFVVGAPFTTAQILAFPELGYVSRQLNVMIYGYPCQYEGIKNFNGLHELDVDKTVWIAMEDPSSKRIDYPIGPHDKVLGELESGERKAKLFVGGVAIEQMRRMILNRILANQLQFKSN